jgi:hypothetical protein
MPSACANVPPGAILPGLTERKPSGIPAATVSRPWGFGQFQLSFPSSLGGYLAPPVKFAQADGILWRVGGKEGR